MVSVASIRVCQGFAVALLALTCVSLIYLTAAVYIPAIRVLASDFSESPVMCKVAKTEVVKNCDKYGEEEEPSSSDIEHGHDGSCAGKKHPGLKIYVDVRAKGTNVKLEDCDPETFETKYCDLSDPGMRGYECINGGCASLHGLFTCISKLKHPTEEEMDGATCYNLTSIISCIGPSTGIRTDAPIYCNSKKACMNLNGLYICEYGLCGRIQSQSICEKKCSGIPTQNKNLVIRQGNKVHTAKCGRATDITTGEEIWPNNFKKMFNSDIVPVLMMSCTTLVKVFGDNRTYELYDCINGTLVAPDHFENETDITHISQAVASAETLADFGVTFVPPEIDLRIYNATPLHISVKRDQACLSRNECHELVGRYGVDCLGGGESWGYSNFQCFHSPSSSDFVLLDFSRVETLGRLATAGGVPLALLMISGVALVICRRLIGSRNDPPAHSHKAKEGQATMAVNGKVTLKLS